MSPTWRDSGALTFKTAVPPSRLGLGHRGVPARAALSIASYQMSKHQPLFHVKARTSDLGIPFIPFFLRSHEREVFVLALDL